MMMAGLTLKLVSYNSTGLGGAKMEFISDMLQEENVDILLLQETWLLSSNITKLAEINDKFSFVGTSGMDESQLLQGRPYGGLAIMWNKKLSCQIRPVDTGSTRRICAVELNCGAEKFLIINGYICLWIIRVNRLYMRIFFRCVIWWKFWLISIYHTGLYLVVI